MYKEPIIIEFEGIDKSGKETQAELAIQYLHNRGVKVNADDKVSFPDYDTYTGAIIRKCLDTGVPHHPVRDANEFQASMILNRYEKQSIFTRYADNDSIVICDRYMTSMLIYGRLSGVDDKWSLDAQHRMYKPTLTIVLDIGIEEYKRRCSEYTLDIYEKDTSFIERVKDSYISTELPWEKTVVCGEGSVEEVHMRIQKILDETVKRTLHM